MAIYPLTSADLDSPDFDRIFRQFSYLILSYYESYDLATWIIDFFP